MMFTRSNFLVDGDAAALLDINLDALTSMLLTQPERQIVAAPAGTWTIISGDPHDILAVIAEAKCHALIAEGNAHPNSTSSLWRPLKS